MLLGSLPVTRLATTLLHRRLFAPVPASVLNGALSRRELSSTADDNQKNKSIIMENALANYRVNGPMHFILPKILMQAYMLHNLGRHQEALNSLNQIVSNHPKRSAALLDIAKNLLNSNKYNMAQNFLQQISTDDPNYSAATTLQKKISTLDVEHHEDKSLPAPGLKNAPPRPMVPPSLAI
jgi:tetratricopeptide (TPR) repeat protein